MTLESQTDNDSSDKYNQKVIDLIANRNANHFLHEQLRTCCLLTDKTFYYIYQLDCIHSCKDASSLS